MKPAWLAQADSRSPWPQMHVVVAGIGVSGFAAADGLLHFGTRVTILDDVLDDLTSDRGKLLEVLGGLVRLGPGSTADLPDDADLVIATGWPPTTPLLLEAAARGTPIWSEVELAWRLSRPDKIVPWLGITGTNGKTTTTQMLESILAAAGLRTAAVGNIGQTGAPVSINALQAVVIPATPEIVRDRVHPPLHEVLGSPPSALTRGLTALRQGVRDAAARPGARFALHAAPAVIAALEGLPGALEAFAAEAGTAPTRRPRPPRPR